ncbi:flagellar hook assembly protein FlgD [Zavarzinia compransoris]|uniref:flagellar hook assembly protein FlgD n=1 Tax=Zavarzinia marina TaxID=2911065 RepID=UPI001F2243A8|nr:flagellar hook capping FlgD N-terminal domain-containing protein [Zavarzinia marina]MCF4165235.1 flagellar hook assembly protein FlgD [Zavarzinia marina]
MTSVSATSGTTASATAAASTSLAKNFDTFLTLLTTQLQNQDPLDPMDSNEFTAQLVQFTQVEQSINTNKTLETMLSTLQGATVTNAVAYIGKEVTVDTPTAGFDGETPVTWTYGTDDTAVGTVLSILDSSGKVIANVTGASGEGPTEYTWDGSDANGDTVAAGRYTLRVTALDKDGKAVSTDVGTISTVTGVENADGEVTLITGNGNVALDAVTGIYGGA